MDKKTDVLINGEVAGSTSFDDCLMVEIPKKYKRGMEKRWDLRRFKKESSVFMSVGNAGMFAGYVYMNRSPCDLCSDFLITSVCADGSYIQGCKNCPFDEFKKDGNSIKGCVRWLALVAKDWSVLKINEFYVGWPLSNDKKARKQMKEIRKMAKKYIKWV
ncbi:hypothetical protein KAX97_10775 [candidate division WOR-3 bacterium]|nr:hypothetical protein [candidate division WOR-3 bacterium]